VSRGGRGYDSFASIPITLGQHSMGSICRSLRVPVARTKIIVLKLPHNSDYDAIFKDTLQLRTDTGTQQSAAASTTPSTTATSNALQPGSIAMLKYPKMSLLVFDYMNPIDTMTSKLQHANKLLSDKVNVKKYVYMKTTYESGMDQINDTTLWRQVHDA